MELFTTSSGFRLELGDRVVFWGWQRGVLQSQGCTLVLGVKECVRQRNLVDLHGGLKKDALIISLELKTSAIKRDTMTRQNMCSHDRSKVVLICTCMRGHLEGSGVFGKLGVDVEEHRHVHLEFKRSGVFCSGYHLSCFETERIDFLSSR